MEREHYEGWSNTELADALIENDKFLDECVDEGREDYVWQWDRSDLIDYCVDYLNQ